MRLLGSCYCGICRGLCWLQSPFLLIIRLFWGILFFLAGVAKFGNIESTISGFNNLGFSWPTFLAYLVSTTETVGGLLLIVGLLSRLVSIPLAIVMITALFTAHQSATMSISQDPATFLAQAPVTYLYTVLVVMFFGPGFFSVDEIWKKTK